MSQRSTRRVHRACHVCPPPRSRSAPLYPPASCHPCPNIRAMNPSTSPTPSTASSRSTAACTIASCARARHMSPHFDAPVNRSTLPMSPTRRRSAAAMASCPPTKACAALSASERLSPIGGRASQEPPLPRARPTEARTALTASPTVVTRPCSVRSVPLGTLRRSASRSAAAARHIPTSHSTRGLSFRPPKQQEAQRAPRVRPGGSDERLPPDSRSTLPPAQRM